MNADITPTSGQHPAAINGAPTHIAIGAGESVTAIVYAAAPAADTGISLVLAHGAGANQMSGFMVLCATALASRGIETITFNFLYSETGRRLPDRNDRLEACWRTVLDAVRPGRSGEAGARRLMIGGKSMGGRIASQVAAADRHGIEGLVFLGYPLHPPGRPDKLRSQHLARITAPMLFVQGARDAFGTPDELRPILQTLKVRADLLTVAGGDHSFMVPKRSGIPQDQVFASVFDAVARWMKEIT